MQTDLLPCQINKPIQGTARRISPGLRPGRNTSKPFLSLACIFRDYGYLFLLTQLCNV
jgi:hypothetical protein